MSDAWKTGLDSAATMMKMWTDWMSRMMQAGMAFSPDDTPPDAFRNVRSAMLRSWAESWEQFARSPQFLEWMRLAMAGGAHWQKQMMDLFTGMQHQMFGLTQQGMDPMTAVAEGFQRQVMSSSGMLTSQWQQLAQRIDAIEQDIERRRQARKEKVKKHSAKNGKR